MSTPYTSAVWLTASEELLTDRIHTASKFLARSTLYQSRMQLDGLARISTPASPAQILHAARPTS